MPSSSPSSDPSATLATGYIIGGRARRQWRGVFAAGPPVIDGAFVSVAGSDGAGAGNRQSGRPSGGGGGGGRRGQVGAEMTDGDGWGQPAARPGASRRRCRRPSTGRQNHCHTAGRRASPLRRGRCAEAASRAGRPATPAQTGRRSWVGQVAAASSPCDALTDVRVIEHLHYPHLPE